MNKKIKIFTIGSLLTLLALSYPRLTNAQVINSLEPQSAPVNDICAITGENNVLKNPNFESANPNYTPGNGSSSALNWTVWNNGGGSTTTTLEPIPLSNGQKMIHVTVSPGNGGIVQAYQPTTNAQRAIASAWVFVKSGQVGIGVGNGGSTSIASNAYSSTLSKWERLQSRNSTSPVNQVIIYAGNNGAEFYVANACVTNAP